MGIAPFTSYTNFMFRIIISSLLLTISILIAIAFFTLIERKVLGYCQLRKGPNKPSLAGLPVPLADAVKLFSKEQIKPLISNIAPFYIAPFLALSLALMLANLMPSPYSSIPLSYSAPLFSAISRLNIYATLTAGWARNSKYAIIGTVRGMAQTISYEVGISLCMLIALTTMASLSLFVSFTFHIWPLLISPILFPIWFATILAETNRTPYDLIEGESELVSGFNIEYRAGPFAIIFIAEYTRIIAIRIFSVSLFSPRSHFLIFTIKILFVTILFLWARATLPRIRYDNLIYLIWLSFLPLTLGLGLFLIALFMLLESSLIKIRTLEVRVRLLMSLSNPI